MKPPVDFDQLAAEYAKDSKLEKENIDMELLKVPSLICKYASIHSHHSRAALALGEKYREMKEKRAAYYRGEYCYEDLQKEGWEQYQYPAPKYPTDMKQLLDTDSILIKILLKKQLQESIVSETEIYLKELHSRGYLLRTIVDNRRFLIGQN